MILFACLGNHVALHLFIIYDCGVFMFGKRGAERTAVLLVEILVVILTLLVFFRIGAAGVSEDGYLLDFYADDLVLLIDSLQVAPHDVDIIYPLEPDFVVSISESSGRAQLEVKHLESTNRQSREIHLLKGFIIEDSTLSDVIIFSKRGTVISLSESLNVEECPRPLGFFDDKKITLLAKPVALPLRNNDVNLIVQTFSGEFSSLNFVGSETVFFRIGAQVGDEKMELRLPIDEHPDFAYIACRAQREMGIDVVVSNVLDDDSFEVIFHTNDMSSVLSKRDAYAQIFSFILGGES